jgi:hypothetical protein
MKIRITLLIAILTALASAAFAQTAPETVAKPAPAVKLPAAQEVVAKYVKAIGGREAIEKIKSRTTTGTVEMSPMGLKGTFETVAAAPVAWSVNPIQGSRDKSGTELLQTKITNDFYRDIRLEKIYPKMTVTGIEKVGDKDAHVVRAEPVGLNADMLYFDVDSGLLVRVDSELVSPVGTQKARTFYDEYKPFDGVMIPTKTRTVLPQVEVTMTVTDAKSNTPVDQARFAKPKV